MNSIIYIVGLVVIVLFVLSFFGLRCGTCRDLVCEWTAENRSPGQAEPPVSSVVEKTRKNTILRLWGLRWQL